MELQQYISLVRRWLWLILLAAFVAGSVSYITRSNQPPLYRTNVTVSIGSFIRSPNPDLGDINAGRNLVTTYEQLVETFDVLQATIETLNLSLSVNQMRDIIGTQTVLNTSLLQITVTYTDPILAADIANELAQQLIRLGPSGLTPEERARIDFLNDQIEILSTELDSLRSQLVEVTTELNETDDQEEADELASQRASLIDQINATTANIGQFSANIASLQERTNTVEIVENARVANQINSGGVVSAVLLGAMVGASLAFGGVLLLEYLNNSFRTSDEVTAILNVPVLGVVSRFGKNRDGYEDKLLTKLPIVSHTPEEYRTVRTNLIYSTQDKRRTYLITSASPSEGKSVTAANIAVSMALSGMRVLLIDADLRRPKIHSIFGLSNEIGLTTLLAGGTGDDSMDNKQYVRETWERCMQETSVQGLKVITSGFIPSNPTEILGSALMSRWIRAFRESRMFDVIIFDTPPVLALSDATVLAASIEASVVLVVEANKTRVPSAIKAKERFEQVGVNILGVVLNNANLRDESYYGYNYGGYYYQPQEQQQPTE